MNCILQQALKRSSGQCALSACPSRGQIVKQPVAAAIDVMADTAVFAVCCGNLPRVSPSCLSFILLRLLRARLMYFKPPSWLLLALKLQCTASAFPYLEIPPCPCGTSTLPACSCRGEGMPISKQPGQKGNIIIKFDVAFPRQLDSSQKERIRAALPAS